MREVNLRPIADLHEVNVCNVVPLSKRSECDGLFGRVQISEIVSNGRGTPMVRGLSYRLPIAVDQIVGELWNSADGLVRIRDRFTRACLNHIHRLSMCSKERSDVLDSSVSPHMR